MDQVFCVTPSREYGALAAWSSPQRTPAFLTHSESRLRSSSWKPNRRRTGPRDAKSSTSETVTRASARSSRRLSTLSTGLVWRSERSASLTFNRWAG